MFKSETITGTKTETVTGLVTENANGNKVLNSPVYTENLTDRNLNATTVVETLKGNKTVTAVKSTET